MLRILISISSLDPGRSPLGWLTRPHAHVGDVQEAVDAAEVDEHAEVGDVLDRTHADLALLDVLEQRLLLLLTLLLEELPAGDDDVHALRIDLDDARANGLVDEVGDVVRAAQRDLARGQEDVDALDVDEQTALDLALDDTLDLVALGVLLGDVLPRAETIGAALREHRHVVLVQAFEVDLEGLPLRRELIAELVQRDLPFGLAADVHDDEPGALVDRVDLGLDDLAGADVDDGLVETLLEVLERLGPEGFGDSLLELFGVEFVLADAARSDGHGKNRCVSCGLGPGGSSAHRGVRSSRTARGCWVWTRGLGQWDVLSGARPRGRVPRARLRARGSEMLYAVAPPGDTPGGRIPLSRGASRGRARRSARAPRRRPARPCRRAPRRAPR